LLPPGWGEPSGPEHYEVWPENWEAVILFCGLATQWKVGAFGGFIGLDYAAVEADLRLQRVRDRARVYQKIKAMEYAALPILNKTADPDVLCR